MKTAWNGEYISPYAEHGKKSEQVKITVSIPLKVLKILTDERTRRQINNLRHATNSELLCEAFYMLTLGNHYQQTTIFAKTIRMISRWPCSNSWRKWVSRLKNTMSNY